MYACGVHTCVCVFCLCVGALVHVGTHMYGGLRLTLGVLLDCSSLYSLMHDLSIEPRAEELASQANQLVPGISCCLSAGMAGRPPCPLGLSVGAGVLILKLELPSALCNELSPCSRGRFCGEGGAQEGDGILCGWTE